MADPMFPLSTAPGGASSWPSPPPPPPDGEAPGLRPRIAGYEVGELIGRGGMGSVWRAVDLATHRSVALKLMGTAFGSPRLQARFEREVELASRLEHPHIARVYRSGVSEGLYYYAMELVEGVHLDQYVRDQRLELRAILALMLRVTQAVQHAHQRGVIHRDLKPANILITPDGQPHVIDFGLAKSAVEGESGPTLSLEGTTVGTLAYMSPEQAAGKTRNLDTRSDVYSLGVILYQLVTGQLPHDHSPSQYESQRQVVEEEVRRPRAANPAVDAELEALLLKALAKDPEQRYPTAGELAADLQRYLNHEPLAARPLTAGYFLRKWVRKHRMVVGSAAAVTGLLLAVALGSHLRVLAARDQALASAEATRRALYRNRIVLAKVELDQNEIGEAKETLARCPEDLRHWEWRRLMALADQSVATLPRLGGPIIGLAETPDGGKVVAVGPSGNLAVWDRQTGKSLQSRPPDTAIMHTLVTRDGSRLIVVRKGEDGNGPAKARSGATIRKDRITVEDLAAQAPPRLLCEPEEDVQLLALGAEDRQLAMVGRVGQDERLRIRDLDSGKLLLDVPASDEPAPDAKPESKRNRGTNLSHLAFASSGRFIALIGETTRVLELPSARHVATLPKPAAKVVAATFSGDDRHLALGGTDGGIEIWDRATGVVERRLTSPEGAVHALRFSPDGQLLASGGADKRLRIWDVVNGRLLQAYRGHEDSITALCFSADGRRVVSAGADSSVKCWDVALPSSGVVTYAAPSPTQLGTLAWSPDGRRFATGDNEGSILLWDAASGRSQPFAKARGAVSALAWDAQGANLLAAAAAPDGSHLTEWATATGQARFSAPVPGPQAQAVRYSPDGRWIAVAFPPGERGVAILAPGTGQAIRALPGGTGAAFSPDGTTLLTTNANGTALVLWRTGTWQPLATLLRQGTPATQLVVAASGWCAATLSADGTVTIWDLARRRPGLTFRPEGSQPVAALALSADGRRLFTAGAAVCLWDTETGDRLLEVDPASHARIAELALGSRGERLLGLCDNAVLGWGSVQALGPLHVVHADHVGLPVAHVGDPLH